MDAESLDRKIRRLVAEDVIIVPYDPMWPVRFAEEAARLRTRFSAGLVGRIEHFGSTAVPGLAAKPIVDMLIEVASLDRARREIVPALESERYDYVWRPTHGDSGEPFYAWFIRRGPDGRRTHHLHMVEPSFAEHWKRLVFRDYLIAHPGRARDYERLKRRSAQAHPNDRAAYTNAKSAFIRETMAAAERSGES